MKIGSSLRTSWNHLSPTACMTWVVTFPFPALFPNDPAPCNAWISEQIAKDPLAQHIPVMIVTTVFKTMRRWQN